MARYVNNIIYTTGDPIVTIFITPTAVTSKEKTIKGFKICIYKTLMVSVDSSHLSWPASVDTQGTFTGAFKNITVIVNYNWVHAEEGAGGATWF